MNGDDVIREARNLLGVPYARQGRDPRVALDCVGLVIAVGWALGVEVHAPHDYSRFTSAAQAVEWAKCSGLQPAAREWSPGRVVIQEGKGGFAHLAIATERGLIHVSNCERVRSVVEAQSRVADNLVAAFEYPGEAA